MWLWEDVGNPCCKLWLRWVWSVWAGVPCHPGPGGPHSHHPGHLRLTHNSRENNPRLRGSGDLKISASLCWLCWSTINEQWLFRLCKISLFEFLRRLVQCSMKWRDVSDYDYPPTFSPMELFDNNVRTYVMEKQMKEYDLFLLVHYIHINVAKIYCKYRHSIDRQCMDGVRIEMFFFDHFKGSVVIRSWGRHVRSSWWRNTIRGHVLEVSTEARVSSLLEVRVTSAKMTSSYRRHRVYLSLFHVSDAKCADCPLPFVSAQNITRAPKHGIICRRRCNC